MTNNEFAITRNIFAEHINYQKPMSFEEWMDTSDDLKAAVLFVQFYEQITLAWFKLVSVYATEQDGVAEVLQYLMKNVDIIKNNPNRFTPNYIYTVAYNCLFCLCRRNGRSQKIYDNECVASNIPGYDEEHDVFDTVPSDGGFEDSEIDKQREAFWSLIESKGRDTIVVVAELLGDTVDWTSEKLKKFTKWDTRKISDERREEILAELREDLTSLKIRDSLNMLMAM